VNVTRRGISSPLTAKLWRTSEEVVDDRDRQEQCDESHTRAAEPGGQRHGSQEEREWEDTSEQQPDPERRDEERNGQRIAADRGRDRSYV
jgi:hypothetical protein